MQVEERNHAEAVLDVSYGECFNALCESYWRRIDNVCGLVSVIGGGSVFVGVLVKWPMMTAIAALLVAIFGAMERVLRPVENRLLHAEFRQRFGELHARAHALSLAEVDAQLRLLQASGPTGISALALPAYNDNLRTSGFDMAVRPEGWWNRVARVIA